MYKVGQRLALAPRPSMIYFDHYIIQGRRIIIFFKDTSNFCFNVWNIYFSNLILS
jgi:hypothetical protein